MKKYKTFLVNDHGTDEIYVVELAQVKKARSKGRHMMDSDDIIIRELAKKRGCENPRIVKRFT